MRSSVAPPCARSRPATPACPSTDRPQPRRASAGPRSVARALVGLLAVRLAACTHLNPAFETGDDATSPSSTGVSAASESPATGAVTASSGSSTTAGTATGGEPSGTGTDPVATTTSGDASTSTGQGPGDGTSGPGESTGVPVPGSETVVAALATCVLAPAGLFPHLGPKECEQKGEAEDGTGPVGVMIVDTEFINQGGAGRPARALLRFEPPAALAGKTLTKVTLEVTVSAGDSAGSDGAGTVSSVEAFDATSLNTKAPAPLVQLAGDPGACTPGQVVQWDLPVMFVVPGQPLYLGIFAIDSDGVLYRSSRAPGPDMPRLVIDYT